MPSFIYDEKTEKLISSEEYYLQKYSKMAHLRMLQGNKPVTIYYNSDEMMPARHMINNKYKFKYYNNTWLVKDITIYDKWEVVDNPEWQFLLNEYGIK